MTESRLAEPLKLAQGATASRHAATSPGGDEQLTPERLRRENFRNDRILAGLALILTFLLASYPVGNSDALMHLRIGELIAKGEFIFGQDPFSYTVSNDTVWVHPGWLLDLLLYGIYAVSGGAGLVLFRGFIALALAVVFLQFRKPGDSLLTCSFATILSMLVLSQRMFIRPELVSFLFLGLTLVLLWAKPQASEKPQVESGWRRSWLWLPPLFWIWVNMDHWFFLGPAVVGLYLLGEVLQDLFSEDTGRDDKLSATERGRLGVILAAGVAACLLNPYFYRVFQWKYLVPGELWSVALETFRDLEPEYRRLGISPLVAEYFRETSTFFRPMQLSFAEWAYYLLALFGAISFVFSGEPRRWGRLLIWLAVFALCVYLAQNVGFLATLGLSPAGFLAAAAMTFVFAGEPRRWGRLLVWTAFLALSAYQARNAGFLAVVTAPIAILNLQERGGALPSVERRWVSLGQFGRALMLLAVLLIGALLIVAKDPTVQALGGEAPRGLVHGRGAPGWTLTQDLSWKRASDQLENWRAEGKLTGNTFHPRIDLGHYLLQGKRNFIDIRFSVHGGSAAEFIRASQALRKTGTPRAFEYDWQDVFRRHDISHVVIDFLLPVLVSPQDRAAGFPAYPAVLALVADEANWEQLDYTDGQTFILAWKKSPHWERLRPLRYDASREAFRAPTRLPPAEGPPREAPGQDALATILGASPPPPAALYEAEWHKVMHDRAIGMIRGRLLSGGPRGQAIEAMLGQIGHGPAQVLAGAPLPPLPLAEPVPTGRVILALRAVRRAIAENPEEPEGYRLLLSTYQLLNGLEVPPFSDSPAVQSPIREMQMFFALKSWAERSGGLRDPNANPHLMLAERFADNLYLDLALDHYRLGVLALRNFGTPPGVSDKEFEKFLLNLDQRFFGNRSVDQIERLVRETEAQYRTQVADPRLRENYLTRAELAMRLNPACRLGKEALQDLQKAVASPSPDVRRAGFSSLIEHCLNVGEFAEARQLLRTPKAEEMMGRFPYHQTAGLVSAAYGEYDSALRHLAQVDAGIADTAVQRVLAGFQTQLLGGHADFHGAVALRSLAEVQHGLGEAMQRSDSLAVMGLLALEAGRVRGDANRPGAAELFQKAVEVYPDSAFRSVAGRYYFLITGQLLPAPR